MRAITMAAMTAAAATGAMAEAPPNLLGFAQGTLPVAIEADPAAKVRFEHAIRAIDGARTVYGVTSALPTATTVAFVYELAAPTVFERFSVPNVRETPSPSQTFFREVKVLGSPTSAKSGFVLLASGTLSAQAKPDQATALALQRRDPVRWVRVELSGALDANAKPPVWLEFSEIVAEGRQEPASATVSFAGPWQGRGLALALEQDGVAVTGCYDRTGRLEGTVSGRILRATGTTSDSRVRSVFVAGIVGGGELYTLRSTNGAPFQLHVGERASGAKAPACPKPARPPLGCGAIVHGIGFDFDSATLRPDAAPVLDALRRGLAREGNRTIRVEGHTSSEGEAAYNLALSQRRAQAVVDALVVRGLSRTSISASGAGEARPIAPNDDDAGRSMNRRVEIVCT
jgi:outer membrane protein OmpA-like peptidoglycan-associated protein